MDIYARLANELNINIERVKAVIDLLNEGCTVPFIARYRKEKTGNMSDVILREFESKYQKFLAMDEREKSIVRSLKEQGVYNEELAYKIEHALTLQELEDIYLPYRPKRKTRASEAKRKGLLPLSELIEKQKYCKDFTSFVTSFLNEEVPSLKEALEGAIDILAEKISEDSEIRKRVRFIMQNKGFLVSKKVKENPTYELYYDFKEEVKRIPPHRILAINRGENEGILKVKIDVDVEEIYKVIERRYIHKDLYVDQIKLAISDAFKRLLNPSLTTEIRNELKEKAEEESLKIFASNAREKLLEPPLKGKVVLGFDPAFRTGCKLAIVSPNGDPLYIGVIYPTEPQNQVEKSKEILVSLIDKYHVDIIALGNGTASRESEAFLKPIVLEKHIHLVIVDESGASVYSASELGSEEFPTLDASKRSAISLARRLQDPLCELVKIPSKSLGVGQYQHDMNQKNLKETLDHTVMDCVNAVGVDLNSASKSLLMYVSGINEAIANSILEYRKNHLFTSRDELLTVKKLGAKSFEQCAGFLRIKNGSNPLDALGIHPEQYEVTRRLLTMYGLNYKDIGSENLKNTLENVSLISLAKELNVGEETLKDIILELEKPDRDIRGLPHTASLRSDIKDISELKVGMILEGTIRNVVDFGAFVDIGVHQDGLIHVSELSKDFVRYPLDVVHHNQVVKVKVIAIDPLKKRIALSLKDVDQD